MKAHTIFDIPVHETANVFPMLDDNDLAELAADIKENGLRMPLVVTGSNGDMTLIDGRNRRAACKLAGVEPTVTQLEGDPVSFIVSANIHRRDLMAGQRTMIMAKIYPDAAKGGRGKRNPLLSNGFNHGELSKARTVLSVLPVIADQVIAGTMMLNAAYGEAVEMRDRDKSAPAQMAKIKSLAPDLYDLVEAGQLTLSDAGAALKDRQRIETERKRQLRLTTFGALRDGLAALQFFANSTITLADFFTVEDRAEFDRFFAKGELQTLCALVDRGAVQMTDFANQVGSIHDV